MVSMENTGFFKSDDWASVLESGLGAKFVDCSKDGVEGCAIPVFCKGPIHVAYPGFPIGGTVPVSAGAALGQRQYRKSQSAKWHLLRLWQSSLYGQFKTSHPPISWIPETVISDLKKWSQNDLPSSVIRNVKKAEKKGLLIEAAQQKDSDRIFELYRSVILSKKGGMRYTQSYFRELVKVSKNHPDLKVNIARTVGGDVASMVVYAYHRDYAFYLHGASDFQYSSIRPADALMFNAICTAKLEGKKAFSFLPSPIDQIGLIRFKEKWGGVTALTPVYDFYQPSVLGKGLQLALLIQKFIIDKKSGRGL